VIELEDLFHRIAPAHPTDEIDKIRVAVLSILSALSRGEGVVVHCAGGTGRTGTVIGATLAVLGVPVSEAIRHLQLVHEARGRSWPESSWQQDVLEQRGVDWEPTAKA
jgi:protein-tyrosine phosphatase